MTWILLPGMDGTGDFFAPFVAALPKSDVAVVVRYPRSRTLSWQEYVRSIDESLPITREYVILAESFSGAFALEIASRNSPPKRLRALVLCASFAKSPISTIFRMPLKVLGPVAMRLPPPLFILRNLLMDKNASSDALIEAWSTIRSVGSRVLADRLKIVCDLNLSSLLPMIKVPTLVLGAARDKLVSKRVTDDLANGIPKAKLAWIDGPHFLAYCRPKEVLTAALEFLGIHGSNQLQSVG